MLAKFKYFPSFLAIRPVFHINLTIWKKWKKYL